MSLTRIIGLTGLSLTLISGCADKSPPREEKDYLTLQREWHNLDRRDDAVEVYKRHESRFMEKTRVFNGWKPGYEPDVGDTVKIPKMNLPAFMIAKGYTTTIRDEGGLAGVLAPRVRLAVKLSGLIEYLPPHLQGDIEGLNLWVDKIEKKEN